MVGIPEYYSKGKPSASSEAAEAAGVLVRTLDLPDSLVPEGMGPIRILDAWIEEDSRLEYRFFLFGRRIYEGTYSVVVNTDASAHSNGMDELVLIRRASGDTLQLVRRGGRTLTYGISPPFDETVFFTSKGS